MIIRKQKSTAAVAATTLVIVLTIFKRFTFGMSFTVKPTTTRTVSSSSDPSAATVSLLTWNVNGLDPDSLHSRANAASNEILKFAPDIVFLQEVVQSTETIFCSMLEPLYKCCSIHDGIRMNGYYTLLFVRAVAGHAIVLDERITFDVGSTAQSFMGRDLQKIVVKLKSQHEVAFFNSHLESLKESAPIRTAQLTYIFERMMNLDLPACLAGDLNMRNVEQNQALKATNAKDSIVDAYEYFGKPRYASGTWLPPDYDDPTKKSFKCRFDRVYHNSYDDVEFISATPNGSQSKPIILVGDEKLCRSSKSGKMERPSDHLGMFIRLKLKNNTTRKPIAKKSAASKNICSSEFGATIPRKVASPPKNSGKKRDMKRMAYEDNYGQNMNMNQWDEVSTMIYKKSADEISIDERRRMIIAAAAESRINPARNLSTTKTIEQRLSQSKEVSSNEVIDLT